MSLGTLFFNNTVKNGDLKRLSGQKKAEGVEEIVDIPYVSDGHKYHLLDIYKPKDAAGKLPVIIDIHGGGWVYGDKELNKYYCLHLAAAGFAVVNVSYRLCPEVKCADSLKDVNLALDWVADNGESYGLDTDNAFLTGDSAGGHYCALVLAAKENEKLKKLFGVTKLDIKAVGFTCAAFNPSELAGIPFAGIVMFDGVFGRGYKHGKNKELYLAADFKNNIPANMPPSYFITAYADFLQKQNLDIYAELQSRGIECEMTNFDAPLSDGHKLVHVYNVIEPWWEASQTANRGMLDFFKKHVRA